MIDAGSLCLFAGIGCERSLVAWLSAVLSPMAAIAALIALLTIGRGSPWWERLGLALVVIGSAGEAAAIWSSMAGNPMAGGLNPWWAAKNGGISILAAAITFQHMRAK
jgi:hypothetical protein